MPNVVVLIKDERVRRQVQQFGSELSYNDLQFAYPSSVEEFERTYLQTEAAGLSAETPSSEALPVVDFLIVSLDSIVGKVGPWIENTRRALAQNGLLSQKNGPRLVLLKYEDDNIAIQDLTHPRLDDVIYLPLDRSLFLQKLDILLGLPVLIEPRFLFAQKADFQIEISKSVRLDRLSDVGLAIRNPLPLKKGLSAHFYFRLPGEKEELSVFGKVIRSEPHPDSPDHHLVFFSFQALERAHLTRIRQNLAKRPHYKSLLNDNRDAYRFHPGDVLLTDNQRRLFHIVVLEHDEKAAQSIRHSLTKDFDRVQPFSETSYTTFLHKYFDREKHIATDPKFVEADAFYHQPLKWTVDAHSRDLLQVEKLPEVGDLMIGHPANAIFATPDGWLKLFVDPNARVALEEALYLARRGRSSRKIVSALNFSNELVAVALTVTSLNEGQHADIAIEPATSREYISATHLDEIPATLDAIIVDAAFVPSDVKAWITGLREKAAQSNMLAPNRVLKIIITTDKESPPPLEWLNHPDIIGIFPKPIDMRQMGFNLSEALDIPFTPYRFDNLTWAEPNLSIHVAKETQLESVSEFGVTLCNDGPIAPGHVVYLRKSIYENAPNGYLPARVYSANKHPRQDGKFQCRALYFGITDEFLKYARTWIREHYTTLKKQV